MQLQRNRRTTPYPWTWELPVAAIVFGLLALVLAAHAGRALANATAGGGWTFPPRDRLITSLPGLLGGDATAGLANVDAAGGVAGAGLLYTGIGLAEVAVLVLLSLAASWAWRRHGPTRLRGMATATEAEQLLGVSRLRRHRQVIRPDLYGPPTGRDGGSRRRWGVAR